MLSTAVVLTFLQSCYIADAYLVEEPPQPISLQNQCEKSVQKYIFEKKGTLLYTGFTYSDIEIHVPEEIMILEDMEKNKAEGFLEGPETDSIIAAKRQFIETNNIQRTIYLEHFYTLRNYEENHFTILQTKFILDDTLGVFDFTPIIFLTAPIRYETALNYYMNEYTIFNSQDIIEARKLSTRFYYFFKKRLAELSDVETKSAFLLHSLKATHFVFENRQFIAADFIKSQTEEFVTREKDSTISYTPLAFSPLYEKSYDGKITGYYIFHKFSLTKNGKTGTIYAVQLEVSPYYEILTKSYLEAPFDDYFN